MDELLLFLTHVAPKVAPRIIEGLKHLQEGRAKDFDRYLNLALLAVMAEQNEQVREMLDHVRAQLDRNSEALAILLKRTEKL